MIARSHETDMGHFHHEKRKSRITLTTTTRPGGMRAALKSAAHLRGVLDACKLLA